jgi:hypothetical protein
MNSTRYDFTYAQAWGGGVERGRVGKERNLVISPVAEADSGNYVCEAISKGEQAHLKVGLINFFFHFPVRAWTLLAGTFS